jgi:hypothetical protein
MWSSWPVKHAGTRHARIPCARCAQAWPRFSPGLPSRDRTQRPQDAARQRRFARSARLAPRGGALGPGPGGDAQAVTPARLVRTSTPGTTSRTTVTTGRKLESKECGTLPSLMGRLPQPHANQRLKLGRWRDKTLPGRPPGPRIHADGPADTGQFRQIRSWPPGCSTPARSSAIPGARAPRVRQVAAPAGWAGLRPQEPRRHVTAKHQRSWACLNRGFLTGWLPVGRTSNDTGYLGRE